jgi:hypothetical protein
MWRWLYPERERNLIRQLDVYQRPVPSRCLSEPQPLYHTRVGYKSDKILASDELRLHRFLVEVF